MAEGHDERTEPEPPKWPAFGRPTSWRLDGSLIRQDGLAVVFVMSKGKRRPFRDAQALEDCIRQHVTLDGAGWNEVDVLSYEDIDPIPVGEEVAGPADLR